MKNFAISALVILSLGTIDTSTASYSVINKHGGGVNTENDNEKMVITLRDITAYLQKNLLTDESQRVRVRVRSRKLLSSGGNSGGNSGRDLAETCTTIDIGEEYLSAEARNQIVFGLLTLESYTLVDFNDFEIYMTETRGHCNELGGELYKLSVDISDECEAYYNYAYYEDDMIQNSAFVWEAAAGSKIRNFPLCVQQSCEGARGAEKRLEGLINDDCFDGVQIRSDESSGYSMKNENLITLIGASLVVAASMIMI